MCCWRRWQRCFYTKVFDYLLLNNRLLVALSMMKAPSCLSSNSFHVSLSLDRIFRDIFSNDPSAYSFDILWRYSANEKLGPPKALEWERKCRRKRYTLCSHSLQLDAGTVRIFHCWRNVVGWIKSALTCCWSKHQEHAAILIYSVTL